MYESIQQQSKLLLAIVQGGNEYQQIGKKNLKNSFAENSGKYAENTGKSAEISNNMCRNFYLESSILKDGLNIEKINKKFQTI